jgi:hypothetical protein
VLSNNEIGDVRIEYPDLPTPSPEGFIMKKTELESYVKTSFNMTIQDFMQQVVEIDGLGDREIANMLDVSIPTIRKVRKRYGIKRADSSLKRFERGYGPDAVRRFKGIIEDPSSSLADVARHFGFTRENARRIYKKIYGSPYTETYKKKIFLRRLKGDSLKFFSGRLMHLKKVKDKITEMGLDPVILIKAKSHVLVTNNNLALAVMYRSKLPQIRNKKYFPVNVVSKQRQGCDFFILSHLSDGDSTYYIIPNEAMPKKGAMIPVSSDDANGKYSRFKDAWHFLLSR